MIRSLLWHLESQLLVIHGEIKLNRNKSSREESSGKIEKSLRVKHRATLRTFRGTIDELGKKDSSL